MIATGEIELFSHPGNLLGESPRWHPVDKCLYWTDIDAKAIFRQAHGGDKPDCFPQTVKVGCLGFRRSCDLILATSNGFAFWHANNNQMSMIGNPENGKPNSRFNDGLVDASGRFWAGSMTETDATSSLYRLDPDNSIHRMIEGVTISNGLGWNKENTHLYFTDSLRRTIWLFDFDLNEGRLSNRRVFIETMGAGVPDGLAIDEEENIWSVQSGDGKLMVYNPDGDIIHELTFPTRCITACTFGGDQLSDLFVTSSRSLLDPLERTDQPSAGAVFKIPTQSRGISAHFYSG